MVKQTKKIKSAWTKLTMDELNDAIDLEYTKRCTVAGRKRMQRLQLALERQKTLIKLIT